MYLFLLVQLIVNYLKLPWQQVCWQTHFNREKSVFSLLSLLFFISAQAFCWHCHPTYSKTIFINSRTVFVVCCNVVFRIYMLEACTNNNSTKIKTQKKNWKKANNIKHRIIYLYEILICFQSDAQKGMRDVRKKFRSELLLLVAVCYCFTAILPINLS